MYLLTLKPWESAKSHAPSAEETSQIGKAGTDDTALEYGIFARDTTLTWSDSKEKGAEHRE
jgi:hypothetical protein